MNVARVLSNPRFCKSFKVWRKEGVWVNGRFVQSENALIFNGVVTAAGTNDIIQVPEADRNSEILCFHSQKQIFVTNENGTSDEIEWEGNRYKIHQVKNWNQFGYYRALGTSLIQGGVSNG